MTFAPEKFLTDKIHQAINKQIAEFPEATVKVEGFRPDFKHTGDHRRLITVRHGSEVLHFEIVASGDAQADWEVELSITRESGGERHPVPEVVLEISTTSVPTGLTTTVTEYARSVVAGPLAAA